MIPVVDIASITAPKTISDISVSELNKVGDDIIKALTDIGFLYVTNHGIDDSLINTTMSRLTQFFQMDQNTKLKYARDWEKSFCGYLPYNCSEVTVEKFNADRPSEVKEVLDLCHNCDRDQWPNDDVHPHFQQDCMELLMKAQELTRRLMLLVGYGLKLDDPTVFMPGFQGFATANNVSKLRCVHYPPVIKEDIQPGQMRCGEHTDYGTFTLLFLDNTPGLQVFNRKGYYEDVEAQPNGILLNIGELFQRWTGDILHAAKHQVVFRDDTISLPRYSLIYFTSPDNDYPIETVCGNKSYPVEKPYEYFKKRFEDTFVKGIGIDENIRDS